MNRRTVLLKLGGIIAGVSTAGTAAAETRSPHPVVDAMTFTWYGGDRVPNGPMVLLDMDAASEYSGFFARFDVVGHSREYARYIYNSHPVWREYSSVAAINAEINKHYPYAGGSRSGDNVAGIVLWEHGFGTPNIPPDDFTYTCEDLDDWYTGDNSC